MAELHYSALLYTVCSNTYMNVKLLHLHTHVCTHIATFEMHVGTYVRAYIQVTAICLLQTIESNYKVLKSVMLVQ